MPTSTSKRPLILIDFDGVVNVDASSRARSHLCYHEGWRQARLQLEWGPERVFWNPQCGRWLRMLAQEAGAELACASMREHHAAWAMGTMIGLPGLPVAPACGLAGADGGRPPKAAGIIPWTAGRPWAWFDDDEDEIAAAEELAAGTAHKVIPVHPSRGLDEGHVDQAREWLLSLGRPGEIA